MIKVLVVDDSLFIRKTIVSILEKDPIINVVGQAKNGAEAIRMCRELDPDVMTLDIEMPIFNGLQVLEQIMPTSPVPTLILSSLSTQGAEITLKALELGALDFISKSSTSGPVDLVKLEHELITKIKAIARRKSLMRLIAQNNARNTTPSTSLSTSLSTPPNTSLNTTPNTSLNTTPNTSLNTTPSTSLSTANPASYTQNSALAAKAGLHTSLTKSSSASIQSNAPTQLYAQKTAKTIRDLIAIGVSTGGPPAVQKILSVFPADLPVPILIAQHMPASFTGPFAARLNHICKLEVKEAEDGERIRPGHVYISPGGKHIRLEQRMGGTTISVSEHPKEALYKPSANVLMESVGNVLGRRALGVILTGMGNDGLEGMKILKQKGGKALAQSEATCVVYGMPKAIVDANLADEIVDIDNMAEAILASLYR